MREVLLFCAAAGRGTPLRGHHGQGVVCCAEDELRHGALGRVDAEFGGVAGEAVVFIGDGQHPGLCAARSGGALEVRDVFAACAGELAIDKALANVERFGGRVRFIRNSRVRARAAVTDQRLADETAIFGIVVDDIGSAVFKKWERLGGEVYIDGVCAVVDVEYGVETRLFAAGFERTAVFAACGVAVIENRERLVERSVAGVRLGRQAGGGGGRVNAQAVFSVPLIAPAEGLVRIAERQREVRHAVVVEDWPGIVNVVAQCAVYVNLVRRQCDGDAASGRFAGFGDVSALRAAGGDIERLRCIVPVGLHAHEAA